MGRERVPSAARAGGGMIRWIATRIARAMAEEQARVAFEALATARFDIPPHGKMQPPVATWMDIPRDPAEEIAELRADIAELRAKLEAEPVLPQTADTAPIWNVIDDIAPEEGPFRRHMMRVAARLMREPGVDVLVVAGQLQQGEEA